MEVSGENYSTALSALLEIAEKIPSGVSANDVATTITSINEPTEVTEFLQKNISNRIQERLKTFWEANKVDDKLQQLKTLKVNEETKPIANSASTGIYNYARAKSLQRKTKALQERLDKLNEMRLALELDLEAKENLIIQQYNAITLMAEKSGSVPRNY